MFGDEAEVCVKGGRIVGVSPSMPSRSGVCAWPVPAGRLQGFLFRRASVNQAQKPQPLAVPVLR